MRTPFEPHLTHDNELKELHGILAYWELCKVTFFPLIDSYDAEQTLESLLCLPPKLTFSKMFHYVKADRSLRLRG